MHDIHAQAGASPPRLSAARSESGSRCPWLGEAKAEVLDAFNAKIHTGKTNFPAAILCMVFGCLAVWSCLFGCGYLIYGYGGVANGYALGGGLLAVSAVATFILMKLVGKVKLS